MHPEPEGAGIPVADIVRIAVKGIGKEVHTLKGEAPVQIRTQKRGITHRQGGIRIPHGKQFSAQGSLTSCSRHRQKIEDCGAACLRRHPKRENK